MPYGFEREVRGDPIRRVPFEPALDPLVERVAALSHELGVAQGLQTAAEARAERSEKARDDSDRQLSRFQADNKRLNDEVDDLKARLKEAGLWRFDDEDES